MNPTKVNENIIRWGHIWSTLDHMPTSPSDFKEILEISGGNAWIYRRNSPLMIFEEGVFVKSGPLFVPENKDGIDIARKTTIYHLHEFSTEDYVRALNPIAIMTKKCFRSNEYGFALYEFEGSRVLRMRTEYIKDARRMLQGKNFIESIGGDRWRVLISKFSKSWQKRGSLKE